MQCKYFFQYTMVKIVLAHLCLRHHICQNSACKRTSVSCNKNDNYQKYLTVSSTECRKWFSYYSQVKFHSKQNKICIKNEITKALRGVHSGPKYNAIFFKNHLLYTLEHIFCVETVK